MNHSDRETAPKVDDTASMRPGAPAVPDSWSQMVQGAIEAARRAWCDGYAVIVAEINTVLMEKELSLQIAAGLPSPGRTLIECRRRLVQAFRDIPTAVSKLPNSDQDTWKPWSLGFINDQTNPPVSIGPNLINVTGEDLAQIVGFLRQKPKEWPWRQNLVEPIDQDAIQAAQAFDAMLARVGSPVSTAPIGRVDRREAQDRVARRKRVGGRPPKWADLLKVNDSMPAEPQEAVVNAYNKRFAGRIAKKPDKLRATVAKLQQALAYRERRKSKVE